MIQSRSKSSDDVNWEDFSLPGDICNKAKKSNPPCDLGRIATKAKSLLSGHSMWHYTSTNFNTLTDREETLAKELSQIWKKKYTIQKKKLGFLAQKVQEESIRKAFKQSNRSKKATKASKSLRKKLKSLNPPKKFVPVQPIPKKQKELKKTCCLCYGTKKLTNGDETYPCPACNESVEKKSKKKTPFKEQPKPGERKLKF